MSNVPQDVINAAIKVSQWFSVRNIDDWELGGCASRQSLEKLRAQRSNAEPVAIVTVGGQDHGPFSYRETAYGLDHLPDGETKLYTASPDYDAGVAAGMRKAAEICRELVSPSKPTDFGLEIMMRNQALKIAADAILSAIPTDSKAALKDICEQMFMQGMAYEEANHEAGTGKMMEAARMHVNSVLEGKS